MPIDQLFQDVQSVRISQFPKIWWLASWYPSRTEPDNGDFIQRHAIALSSGMPLLVVHTIHNPNLARPLQIEVKELGQLTEVRLYFRADLTKNGLLRKLSYNFRYYFLTWQLLQHLKGLIGIPALIHVHVPMKMGRMALLIHRFWRVPFLVHEHSSEYLDGIKDHFSKRSWHYRQQVKTLYKKAKLITTASTCIAHELEKLTGRNNIGVIPNVVDMELFRPVMREKNNIPFRFLHVSNLSYHKNITGMMAVFSRLYSLRKDFELLIVGGHEVELGYFEHYPFVRYQVKVEQIEVARNMQASDCLVLFSRFENSPCVIGEALACGLPVITSAAGGAGEAIQKNNGIVVPVDGEEKLLEALVYVMDHRGQYDRSLIAGQANYFGKENIAEMFNQLYGEVEKGV